MSKTYTIVLTQAQYNTISQILRDERTVAQEVLTDMRSENDVDAEDIKAQQEFYDDVDDAICGLYSNEK